MAIPFCKFHGFGNDYIVIERGHLPEGQTLGEVAIKMCARNTGIGADGIAVLGKTSGDADYSCEIVNPDGSPAGFSGNGTRCAAAYLHYKNLWNDRYVRLATPSGLKKFELLDRRGESFRFIAEIGKPLFASSLIPVTVEPSRDRVVDEPVQGGKGSYSFSAVNVGNPVAAVFVEDFDMDWREIGYQMESHPIFPERCNIVFVKVADEENIEIRIWERGAGETSSSGTCSAGAAVLSAYLSKTGRRVNVHAEGGTTEVYWRADDEILLTGTAELAFCGVW